MKPVSKILLWILTVFFLIVAILFMPSFGGILVLLAAILTAPIPALKQLLAKAKISGGRSAALIAVLFAIGFFAAVLSGNTLMDHSSSESAPTVSLAPVADAQPEASSAASAEFSVILSWDDPGEYGRKITLNQGTDNEYSYFGFFLPAGKYAVENRNAKTGVQITIYKEGTVTVDGIEEPDTDGCPRPLVLLQSAAGEIELSEGQYIKLSDDSSNVVFTSISD